MAAATPSRGTMGVPHIAPRDGVERMARKPFEYEVGEHGLEKKMVSIDTDMAVRLPAP